ncbi:MAG: phosphate acyltransferase PlsX [Candidatus Eremiobacteraeota bacterium]|nr:phosphate acyltransferase PlsX [Candidatus Eremiobacteraeota bacterium]
MNVAIDAMGGDYAPEEIVKGAVIAARKFPDDNIILVGDRNMILKAEPKPPPNVLIEHTDEYITMDESPSRAIKKKKRSSMKIAAELVREGKSDAIVSAGNTGALLETCILTIGRIKGIRRPALATFFPTKKGHCLLIDSGANAICKHEYLVQFARMGSVYMKVVEGIEKPRVGLINIGEEKGKGNKFYREVFEMMQDESTINFTGNSEPKDFLGGNVDVAVADGFIGNIVLKSAEAAADLLLSVLREEIKKSIVAKVTALILKPIFRSMKGRLDHSKHGGALLIGLKGICIKSHGRADSTAITNAIALARKLHSHRLVEQVSKIGAVAQNNL